MCLNYNIIYTYIIIYTYCCVDIQEVMDVIYISNSSAYALYGGLESRLLFILSRRYLRNRAVHNISC